MAITPDTVIEVAPELSSQTEARILAFINYASPYINRTIWGTKADFAHALFTAHLLTMSLKGGAGGEITSEKVGDLAISYGAGSSGNDLGKTSYGSIFLSLRKTLLISPVVVR